MSTEDNEIDYLAIISDAIRLEKVILIFLGIWFLISLSKAIRVLSNKLYSELPTKKTIIFQISTIFTFFLNIAGSFYIFYSILKPPKELLIAMLGSATFATGLALKDLVTSLISGVTIIMDTPFQVGDRILFNNIYGEIKHIGLRAVRLQTLDNQIVTIPNSSFVNNAVICANPGQINLNVIMKFYLSPESDIEKAKNILKTTVITSRYAYLNEPIIIVVDTVWQGEIMCMLLTLKAHVIDAKYEKAFQTDIITRATKIFLENKFKFPEKHSINQTVDSETGEIAIHKDTFRQTSN